MRLALFISSLKSGGAERVMSLLATQWAERGDEVFLFTYDTPDAKPFYPFHERVQVEHLNVGGPSDGLANALIQNVRRIQAVRKAVKKVGPDVVVSFMDATNIQCILATVGLGIPVVVAEHIHPPCYPLGLLWESLRKLVYPFADKVLVLTERGRDCFGPLIRRKISVMPNPVEVPVASSHQTDMATPSLLAAGRLAEQKGFDLLLEAFAKIAGRFPQWTLTILGDGPLRGELESLRDRLGLEGRAVLPGTTPHIQAYFAAADAFVLSSRFEGFPMALCEAMAAGLPPVSFDCTTGPEEIIRHEKDGLLVPDGDVDALAEAMTRIMEDEALRKRLASNAPEVVQRFGMPRILGLWDAVFNSVGVGATSGGGR